MEMEMNHTPGPWKVAELQGDNVRIQKIRLIRPENDHGYEYGAVCYVYGDESVMCKANARLIAVAPELLDVAMRLVAGYDALDYDIQSEARQAREILAKVTGN